MTKRELLNDEGFEDTFIFDNDIEILGLSHDDRAIYNSSDVRNKDVDFSGKKEPIFITKCDASSVDGPMVLEPDYLDGAIIGITDDSRVVYDYDKLKSAYMDAEGWDEEAADDWISYNTIRFLSYYPNGPIVMFNISYMF